MIAPTNFRAINANANSANSAKNTDSAAISPTLRALLCAARTACAFVRDALVCVAKSIVKLFQQSAAAPTPTTPMATPTTPMATPTTPMVTPTPAPTTLTTTPTPTPTAMVTPTATTTSTATTLPTMASSTSTTRSFSFAPPRSPTMPTDPAIVPGRLTRPDSANAMAHHHASPTSSIWTQLRAVQTVLTDGFPTDAPAPGVPTVEIPDFRLLPPFDDLLLPPLMFPMTPLRYRMYADSISSRSHLAQSRMRVWHELCEMDPRLLVPEQERVEYVCGCGFCPNGTAAYPLCAAVTIRRMMRSFGERATKSAAGHISRRQNACGHRDTMVFGGRSRV